MEQVDFTWDGPVLIEQTTTAPDLPHPVTLTWDHTGFTPVAQTERLTHQATQAEVDRRFFAIVTDLVGTPTELIDATGEIAWHTRTTLWGTTTWNRDATAYTPLRFPGQYADPETGLHYNYFRHYDPDTGRYATPDPLGLAPCSPGTEDDARLALNRAEELQSLRNDYFMTDVKGTTAVIGVFNSESKEYVIRIGINGDGPMPSTWQLRPGEEFVQAPGHAEEGIFNSLREN